MRKFIFIFIILISLIITGCIKEDFDECSVKVKLMFSYRGDGNSEIFMDKHEKVDLYIYNQSDEFVGKKEISKEELIQFQGAYLSLLPGNYRIVCWGNVLNKTKVKEDRFTTSRISHYADNELTDCVNAIDSLYYGTYELNVPETHKLVKDTLISDIIPFQGAHIKFHVKVKGLSHYFPNTEIMPIRISMSKLPLVCDFKRNNTDDKCNYHVALGTGRTNPFDEYSTSFNSMRFSNDNEIGLNLVRNSDNSIFFTLPLKDFLTKENIDVESYNEVAVPIEIEFFGTEIGVGISVKKWDEVIIDPEL